MTTRSISVFICRCTHCIKYCVLRKRLYIAILLKSSLFLVSHKMKPKQWLQSWFQIATLSGHSWTFEWSMNQSCTNPAQDLIVKIRGPPRSVAWKSSQDHWTSWCNFLHQHLESSGSAGSSASIMNMCRDPAIPEFASGVHDRLGSARLNRTISPFLWGIPADAVWLVCNSRISSFCWKVVQSVIGDFGKIFDSSLSIRNIVGSSERIFLTLFGSFVKLLLHFMQKVGSVLLAM